MVAKPAAIYAMANKPNGALYVGATTALLRRVYQQIKAGSRQRKLALIEAGNPTWRDLCEQLR